MWISISAPLKMEAKPIFNFLFLGVALVMLSGCSLNPALNRGAYDRESGSYTVGADENSGAVSKQDLKGYSESGVISYYAKKFHGRKTASGERFDSKALTAAHRTLPFGTEVKVTNLDNGKSVNVRVNDRGPFHADRVMDVSPAAARELGLMGPGMAEARIEVQD